MATPTEILRAVADGQAQGALRELRLALEYPADPGPLAPWCEALGAAARALGGVALADAADAAAGSPDDPDALYALGWHLVDAALHGPAATFLARALALQPGDARYTLELAIALEHAGMNHAARDLLAAAPEVRAADPRARYLYAFNAVMAGDLATARAALPTLARGTDEERAQAARIGDMLARADAVAHVTPLDGEDLRGWHYVLTGGLLLHASPHGRDVMRGRYAYFQDTEAGCLEGILRLRRLLGFLRLEPKALLVLPDRDSTIFATAAAKLLRLPLVPWAPGTKERGLIVAYDLGKAEPEIRRALVRRRQGQILWSHALSWTAQVGLTPEIVGLLHQVATPPWGARLARNPDTGVAERVPPRVGSVEELAARVLAANVEDLPEQAALDALAQAGDVPAAAWRKRGGEREPLWFMGPVKSNRFY